LDAFLIFSQVQEAATRIQQISDEFIVNLRRKTFSVFKLTILTFQRGNTIKNNETGVMLESP